MIKFSELPVQSSAADNLHEVLLRDLGSGPYTPEELRRIVDEGCSIAVVVLKGIDVPMAAGLSSFSEPDQHLVQMVCLTMMLNTLRAAVDVAMMESFCRMMGISTEDKED